MTIEQDVAAALEALVIRHRRPTPEELAEVDRRHEAALAERNTLGEWDAGDDPGPIPPRMWLLGNQFCAGFISCLVSAGGVGKSSLRLLQYISLALGRPLCGQHVFQRCRVLLISLEDDDDELQRRIQAVLLHYGIARSELKGWLFCKYVSRSKIAKLEDRKRVAGPLEQEIRNAIAHREPDLVALDPFVKLHSLGESDSGDMNFVCDLLSAIAVDEKIAVDIPHHVHKGQLAPGDADAGRGSSGIRYASRLNFTLTVMTEEEAKAFNINLDERFSYVRLDAAKVNLVVRSAKATWFRLIGVSIGNGNVFYPNGDTIQVVEPWTPRNIWADLDGPTIEAILRRIRLGPEPIGSGEHYSAKPQAKARAAWRVVQGQRSTFSEAQCRQVIAAWLKSGLLVEFEYANNDSKERSGVKVDDEVAAEVLSALQCTWDPLRHSKVPVADCGGSDDPPQQQVPKEKPVAAAPPPQGSTGFSCVGDLRRSSGESAPGEAKIVGSAPPGTRCTRCGKAGGVTLIKRGTAVDPWHVDCLREYQAVMADSSFELPDLGPDPLDEHGVPHQSRKQEDDR
jgi:hypothetical protein